MKNKKKRNTSRTFLLIEEDFYVETKRYLRAKAEKETYAGTLTIAEINLLKRKNWTLHDEKLKTKDRKNVIKKSELYDILVRAHQRTAHRGQQITSKWINDNYSEVNVRVVNLFVGLCPIHEGNKTITSHVKLVTKSLQSPSFLSMIEIDLMDFRKCPCSCPKAHLWSMNIIDHHTKFVNVTPLHHKTAEDVLPSLRNYCYTWISQEDNYRQWDRIQKQTSRRILQRKSNKDSAWCPKNTNNARTHCKVKQKHGRKI